MHISVKSFSKSAYFHAVKRKDAFLDSNFFGQNAAAAQLQKLSIKSPSEVIFSHPDSTTPVRNLWRSHQDL